MAKALKKAAKKTVKKVASHKKNVNAFMKTLDHPLKKEVEAVRKIIINVDKRITERVKWALCVVLKLRTAE